MGKVQETGQVAGGIDDHGGAAGAVDAGEAAKFGALGERWWDPDGPMRPLHAMNPVRLGYIRAQACRFFGRDPGILRPLGDLRAVDIGCGGGLLAEPLARLGAHVTGVDPVAESIEAADAHGAEAGLAIEYVTGTIEDLTMAGRRFDLTLAMEVIEHTPDPEAFIEALAAATRPGGLIVLSTLSRTWRAWWLAIVGAEYLLRWLPAGTHSWQRFLRPSEVARLMRRHGIRPLDVTGVAYDLATGDFHTTADSSVNYMMAATRD
jgi:2-polyprenyl-6-hydroxyphenyl methylase/3-demethylubiquinone-9 3-methyltransferase